MEGVALSGLLPRDIDETKGNEQNIVDLYHRVSNSDVRDRAQVLGQGILYDLLALKFKEFFFLRNVGIRLLHHVPEETRAHLLKNDPAQCNWLVSQSRGLFASS